MQSALSDQTEQNRHTRSSIRGALEAIDAALVAVRAALASTDAAEPADAAGVWVTQDTAPCGRRAFMAACRAGLIKNARKVGRRWIASRADLERFLEEESGTGQTLTRGRGRGADREADSPPAEVLHELERAGLEYVPRGRKTGR